MQNLKYYMLNMQNMQLKSICKICEIIFRIICRICRFDNFAVFCRQYAKCANKICTICKICFQYAEYALPTLLIPWHPWFNDDRSGSSSALRLPGRLRHRLRGSGSGSARNLTPSRACEWLAVMLPSAIHVLCLRSESGPVASVSQSSPGPPAGPLNGGSAGRRSAPGRAGPWATVTRIARARQSLSYNATRAIKDEKYEAWALAGPIRLLL